MLALHPFVEHREGLLSPRHPSAMRQRGVLESSFYQNACVCWVMPSPVKQKSGGKIQELIKIVAQYKTTTWRETDNVCDISFV